MKFMLNALITSVLLLSTAAYADAGISTDIYVKPDNPGKPETGPGSGGGGNSPGDNGPGSGGSGGNGGGKPSKD